MGSEWVHVSIPFREFKNCRFYIRALFYLSTHTFQSLSGNSRIVGSHSGEGLYAVELSFNPFQGIQELSVSIYLYMFYPKSKYVSIPFREFKNCRLQKRRKLQQFRQKCFNPFQGIQELSVDFVRMPIRSVHYQFQSLSGNSRIVGGECN